MGGSSGINYQRIMQSLYSGRLLRGRNLARNHDQNTSDDEEEAGYGDQISSAGMSKSCYSVISTVVMALALQLPLIVVLMYFLQSRLSGSKISATTLSALSSELNYSGHGDSQAPIVITNCSSNNNPSSDNSNSESDSKPSVLKNENTTPGIASPPPLLQAHGVPHFTFVHMNTYRQSPNTFFVLGITSVYVREHGTPVYACEWHPNNATHDLDAPYQDPSLVPKVDAQMLYIPWDENQAIYVVAIVNCTFNDPIGIEGHGGMLAISVFLGDTRVIVKVEKRGEALEFFNATPKYDYAYCSPPIHRVDRPNWFLQWLTYHHYVFEGKEHFFFYNVGGLTEETYKFMAPFRDAGLITIIEAQEQEQYSSWYHNQALLINDCLQRSKRISKWVFFFDFDEFLDVQPPRTLSSLLDEYRDMPWITLGNMPANVWHCRLPTNENEWPIERFLCRDGFPECVTPNMDPWICLNRRKYIANASKVMASGVHVVWVPFDGGLNLNATIARIYHYRSALSYEVNPCANAINITEAEPPCLRDDGFALRSQEARKSANKLLSPYGLA